MKTQISRNTFAAEKRFSGIYQQMGRMLPDADWNELSELVKERLNDALRDVVGSGTPRGRGLVRRLPGAPPDRCELRWGHAYVDGVPAQARPAPGAALADPAGLLFEYAHQADFPDPPDLPAGDHKLYLDVWERTVTALEDGSLRDPGLHGADTCTRTLTMAQVKWCPLAADPEDPAVNPRIGNALLSLELRSGTGGGDPCDPCAEVLALQDKVGNYLFRVEVHDVAYDASGVAQEITLKWSGENGAEQYPVNALPPGFASNAFAFEFHHGAAEGFATEKHLGYHLETDPAWQPARGALQAGFPDIPPAGFSLVRRWDGFCRLVLDGTDWELHADGGSDRGVEISAASAADAHGHFEGGAEIRLGLDGIFLTLDLGGKAVLAGDYWTVPVRETVHNSGDMVLEAAPPQGILHHYLTVAQSLGGVLLAWQGPGCKALEFPPLTDIRAADVCIDASVCDRSGARTVQEAIDFLCRERDLRWHNKHLHGWGIVCGLQVECGPGTLPAAGEPPPPRRNVRVRPGYALDCEGNDVVLENSRTLDMLDRIAQHEAEHGVSLLEDGAGTVCLILDPRAEGDPGFRLAPYDPEDNDWASMLDGTFLKDVFDDCIGDLLEALKDELTPPGSEGGEGKPLVSAQRKKLTSLLNLIWQLFDSQNGRAVFLSAKEHDILRDFYLRLRELLQSKTFCGMFKGSDFPAYPFPDTGMTTLFGMGGHTRLVLDPDRERAYTFGAGDSTINVYDLKTGELAAAVEMPAGEGAEVVALVVAERGDRVYAAARVRDTDTVFAAADVDGDLEFSWSRVAVICDLLIETMILDPEDEELIFATGLDRGLFFLRPETLLNEAKPAPDPVFAFPASGQLALDAARRRLFAGSQGNAANLEDGEYDRVVMLNLASASETAVNLPPSGTIPLTEGSATRRGRDGLAVGGTSTIRLYVAVEPAGSSVSASNPKQIWTYAVTDFTAGTLSDTPVKLAMDNTDLRLAFHPAADRLLVALEDSHRLQAVAANGASKAVQRIPAQIQPTALAVHPGNGDVYALNFLVNTVSRIPRAELAVTDAFLNELADYRDDVLQAYYALFGSLLQYLKDCFCHHFLVNCPTCPEDSAIYLGCVEIRENQVYKICNFSKRKYVKSFPTVGYWLSLVPIIPLIKQAVEKFCCSILPDIFSKNQDKVLGGQHAAFAGNLDADSAAPVATSKPAVSGSKTRQAVGLVKRTDLKAETRTLGKRAKVFQTLGTDAVLSGAKPGADDRKSVGNAQLIGNSVPEAQAQLTKKGVLVQEVVEYQGKDAGNRLVEFARTPTRLSAGDSVVLYQKDNKVLFYARKQPEAGEALPASVKAELQDFERRKAELQDTAVLRAELREIKTEMAKVQTERASEVAALAELNTQRQSLRLELGRLQTDMQSLNLLRRDLALEISKLRPVTDLGGITPVIDTHLRDLGVRSVSDLANAKPTTLAKAGTLTQARARTLIQEAQDRLKP